MQSNHPMTSQDQSDLVSLAEEAIESSEGNGLLVTFNEKEGTLTMNWNEETHPEYNFLNNCTSEDIIKLLLCHLEKNPNSQITLVESNDVIV